MKILSTKIVNKYLLLMTLICTAGHSATDMLDLYMMGVLPAIASQQQVIDEEKPVLTLNGDASIHLLLGDTYIEQGATCEDNYDETCSVMIGGDTVDTSRVGIYQVTYNATDTSQNRADELMRTVYVDDPDYVVDDFTFTDEIGVGYNQWFSSSITVSGLGEGVEVPISSSGYEGQASHSFFSVNDQAGVTQVRNGDVVEVTHLSSNQDDTTLNTIITIGTKSDTFSTRTKATENTKIPLIVGAPNFYSNAHESYSYIPTLSTDYEHYAPVTQPFTIENKPSWATFNVTTGELSGIPTSTGTYNNIKISAYGDNGMDSIVYDLIVESNPPYINGSGLSLENPDLVLTFNDNADWRSKVTQVALKSCYSQEIPAILDASDYTLAEGTLTLHVANSQNVALHIPTMGGGSIEIAATDYDNNATGLIDYIEDGQYAIKATLNSLETVTEYNVDHQILTINLSNYLAFADNSLNETNFNTWDPDITVNSVEYVSPTEANITLAFNGNDFDSNKTIMVYIATDELNVCQDVSTNSIEIGAVIEKPKNILKTGVKQSVIAGDDANENRGQERSYAYTDNVDSNPIHQEIVRDNITGLQWQDDRVVKEDDYRSFQGDSNWSKANNYCDSLTLVGYDDWRLPNNEELLTLVDYGKSNLAVDGIFNHIGFTIGHPDNYGYWSSNPLDGNTSFAWEMNLANGELHYSGKISQYNAKCVRGNLEENLFKRDENGIVHDLSTGLKWQDNSMSTGAGTIAYAVEYCNDLVLGDESNWRVPNVNELLSITDYSKKPANIADIFENTHKWFYYTSTPSESNNSQYWFVDFDNGGGTYQFSEGNYYVRCVSDENPPAHPTAWISVLDGSNNDGDANHVTIGVELNGTTFNDNLVILIQQNGELFAQGGFVYVDETHAYIEENIEYLTGDEPISFTIEESEITYNENITSNTIIIHPETTHDLTDTVTVGNLMWEDTIETTTAVHTWEGANAYCQDPTLAGYDDWRLSHMDDNWVAEISSIRVAGENDDDIVIMDGFRTIRQRDWITSWTDKINEEAENTHIAMIFQYNIENGDAFFDSELLNVRCVRDVTP